MPNCKDSQNGTIIQIRLGIRWSNMKLKFLAILILMLLEIRGNNASLLDQIQNVGQQVVNQMSGSLEELGNVASVLAKDLEDGVKTVSYSNNFKLTVPKLRTKHNIRLYYTKV